MLCQNVQSSIHFIFIKTFCHKSCFVYNEGKFGIICSLELSIHFRSSFFCNKPEAFPEKLQCAAKQSQFKGDYLEFLFKHLARLFTVRPECGNALINLRTVK